MNDSLKFLTNVGPHWFNLVEVPIQCDVNTIKIEQSGIGYLEFSSLVIESNGTAVGLADVRELTHSKLHPSMGGSADRIFSKSNFHSEHGKNSFVEIKLKKSIGNGRLVMRGHAGRLIGRMHSPTIRLRNDEEVVSTYSPTAAGTALRRLEEVRGELVALDPGIVDSGASVEISTLLAHLQAQPAEVQVSTLKYDATRIDMLRFALLTHFRAHIPTTEASRQRLAVALFYFLEFPIRREWVRLNDYRLLVFALSLVVGYGWGAKSPRFRVAGHLVDYGVFLRSLSAYFHSEAQLIELQNDVSDELRRFGTGAVPMITRHGWLPSKLHGNVNAMTELIGAVFGRMNELGFKGLLAYGTLLGAVRTGRFIAHDDDVDLFVVFELGSVDLSRAALESFVSSIRGSDFEAKLDADYDLVRIVGKSGLVLDVFPLVCLPDGSAVCHHASMKLRSLPKDVFLPASTATLYEKQFAAPAKAEVFLEWRYGPDWRKEKQFFEMEWVYA